MAKDLKHVGVTVNVPVSRSGSTSRHDFHPTFFLSRSSFINRPSFAFTRYLLSGSAAEASLWKTVSARTFASARVTDMDRGKSALPMRDLLVNGLGI
jgi:hypothetical protein